MTQWAVCQPNSATTSHFATRKGRPSMMRHMRLLQSLFVLLCLLLTSPFAAAAKKAKTKKPTDAQVVAKQHKEHLRYIKAMQEEMKRNLKQLRQMKIPKVYHFRYRTRLSGSLSLTARDGRILKQSNSIDKPSCRIKVSLRTGNHKFDNTGQDGSDYRIYRNLIPGSSYCPTKFDPFVFKKMLWRMTDYQYRIAVGQYWRKRYVRSIQPKIFDKAGDLSKEPPTTYMAPLTPRVTLNMKKWKGILKRVSALSKTAPKVISSGLSISATQNVILGVGNDGSKVRLRKWGYTWNMAISYLGKSKELTSASDSGYARFESDLPTESQLRAKFIDMWKKIKAKLEAEEGDPDEGPAIVDPNLAGAMFYDILMVRLESGRFLRKRDPRTFAKQLGKQIIPSFLTIIDNPLLKKWGKTPLSSHYVYDDQWVKARKLVMIKNGVLQRFYMSRKPYKGFKRSNGHGRGSFSYSPFSRPGTTIVKSKREYSLPELRQRLIDEIKRQGKRYGYILKRFTGYSSVRSSIYTVSPEQVFRLDAKTGKVTLLKGLQVRTAALQIIRGIIATGDDYSVFNGSDSENSGNIRITTVTPSLLLKRVAFNRVNLSEKKNYQLPPPFKPTTLSAVIKQSKPAPKACPKTCPAVCKCAVCKK